jgi:hypothetical protein
MFLLLLRKGTLAIPSLFILSCQCIPRSECSNSSITLARAVMANVPDVPLDVPDSYRTLNPLLPKATAYAAEVHPLPTRGSLANFIFLSTRDDWATI